MLAPTYCTKCPFWVDGCSLELRHAIGWLKACPHVCNTGDNLSSPVISEHGLLMNPPWDEKYLLSDGANKDYVALYTDIIQGDSPLDIKYKIRHTVYKSGAVSCNSVTPDIYIMAYRQAIKELMSDGRITDADRAIIGDPFSDRRVFFRRDSIPDTVSVSEPVDEPEPVLMEIITVTETCGDQMELF